MTELEVLEGLDFKPAIPCSQTRRDRPCPHDAAYIINDFGHHDESPEQKAVCKPCWDEAERGLVCARCGEWGPRDDYWMIVSTL